MERLQLQSDFLTHYCERPTLLPLPAVNTKLRISELSFELVPVNLGNRIVLSSGHDYVVLENVGEG